MIRLIPRETKFFRMFAEVSQNVTEGARLLQDILKNPANMAERLEKLQEIEHRGDDMTHCHHHHAESDIYHPVRPRRHPSAYLFAG